MLLLTYAAFGLAVGMTLRTSRLANRQRTLPAARCENSDGSYQLVGTTYGCTCDNARACGAPMNVATTAALGGGGGGGGGDDDDAPAAGLGGAPAFSLGTGGGDDDALRRGGVGRPAAYDGDDDGDEGGVVWYGRVKNLGQLFGTVSITLALPNMTANATARAVVALTDSASDVAADAARVTATVTVYGCRSASGCGSRLSSWDCVLKQYDVKVRRGTVAVPVGITRSASSLLLLFFFFFSSSSPLTGRAKPAREIRRGGPRRSSHKFSFRLPIAHSHHLFSAPLKGRRAADPACCARRGSSRTSRGRAATTRTATTATTAAAATTTRAARQTSTTRPRARRSTTATRATRCARALARSSSFVVVCG